MLLKLFKLYLFPIQLSFDWNLRFPVGVHLYILEEINGKTIQKWVHKALSNTSMSGRCFDENGQFTYWEIVI